MVFLREKIGTILLSLLFLAVFFTGIFAADDGKVILDSYSAWRMFSVLKSPVIKQGNGFKPVEIGIEWLEKETAPVPKGWAGPDFDDSSWLKGPVTMSPNTALLNRLYLRGKITVNNPTSVRSLTLNADFHGGVIVYLNGEEAGRANISKDKKDEVLAEEYPKEAFVDDKGIYVVSAGAYIDGKPGFKPSEENIKGMGLWARNTKINIQTKNIKKGVNVIGIEVIRAPYDKSVLDVKMKKVNSFPADFYFPTCHVLSLQLTAPSASGIVLCTGRPEGFQVWPADILQGDLDIDFGDPSEAGKPVKIIGPRNGQFSGKVHVGSTGSIEKLSAAVSDLKGQGSAVIQASSVKIRYGVPWGSESRGDGTYHRIRETYPVGSTFYGGVSNTPISEYETGKAIGDSPAGAVAPVWITIKIPKDAAPGIYSGTLNIKTKDKSAQVPVELKVLPWALPDPQDYKTWVDLIESPDTLTVEYEMPLWSDKHFKMIAEAFSLMSPTGSRTVYIPAIAHTNLGNEESMIRWIKKGANKYEWDFSIMDKYLDLAEKNLGTPKLVCLQVWEVYMRKTVQKRLEDIIAMSLGVPQVTFYDPATKKTELGKLPPLSDPSSKTIWKELITQVKDRLKKRGYDKALMIGMFFDAWPEKENAEFFKSIAPELSWVQQGHGLFDKLYDVADVGYNATVWGGFRFADGCKQTNQKGEPTTEPLYGWNRPALDAVFERTTNLDVYPAMRWYFFPETGITSELRGIGRIGADYWASIKNKQGRRAGQVHERYKEGQWGGNSISLNLCNPVLSPGIEGPEATNRLFALIEGVEMCEARILIEQAIVKGKISGDLKKRCEETLKERLFNMWRALSNLNVNGPGYANAAGWRWSPGVSGQRYFLGSGWQEQSEKIYNLADEVQKKTGNK